MDLENRKQKQPIKTEDRISKLPDHILHHILSFLPAKLAARTSILSKRWRYSWVYIPVLDFGEWKLYDLDEEDYPFNIDRFMDCMDKVLSFQDKIPNLKKLILRIDDEFNEASVNKWISIAVRRKIEELIIQFNPEDDDAFIAPPPCLFTCESLTMMNLEMNSSMELPESIYLPRLKILMLSYTILMDDDMTRQLFSNCPVLEELILKDCLLDFLSVVSISAPALKFLSIKRGVSDLDNCSFNIYAPSLLSLNYDENIPKDFDLHGFPLLIDADIDFHFVESSSETAHVASKLMKELFNVKRLKMSGNTLKVLLFADDFVTSLPIFRNLIHLEVSSEFPCLAKRTLLDFLQISPNLETLVFAQGFERERYKDDDCWALYSVPQRWLLHLKSVDVWEFSGHLGGVNAIKLLLKNAGNLGRLTFISSSNVSTDMKDMVKLLLQNFPRSSPSCVIKVS